MCVRIPFPFPFVVRFELKVFIYIHSLVQVGTICLSNGQAVEQIAGNHQFCFSVCILIWTFVGMFIGQIRTSLSLYSLPLSIADCSASASSLYWHILTHFVSFG